MATFNASFNDNASFNATMQDSPAMAATFGSTTAVQVGDYNALDNKPKIENVTLEGNKSISDIGVGTLTVQDIEKILYLD